MAPRFDKVYDQEAYKPYSATRSLRGGAGRGEAPMRAFMLKQTRQATCAVRRLAKLPADVKGREVPMRVLVPAFVTSELKSAFQIGFMIFIPFLIIDMIVASVLMSLGMMMLSRCWWPALQADAVRAGRRLEPAARLAGRVLRHLNEPLDSAMDAQQVSHRWPARPVMLLMVSAPRAADGAGGGPGGQHLPGRHADQRGHAELRAQDRGRRGGAGRGRALDADHAGGVHPAHAAGHSTATCGWAEPWRSRAGNPAMC
jgi:hypothetical protein